VGAIDIEALLAAATEARANAYAPYSGFRVGAALLDSAGRVYRGANVENAAYPLSTCAERVALAAAVTDGSRRFRAIAVVGPADAGPAFPCGGCRQILHEFEPEMRVLVSGGASGIHSFSLATLFPNPFGADSFTR
jgi:cytidine deaminase